MPEVVLPPEERLEKVIQGIRESERSLSEKDKLIDLVHSDEQRVLDLSEAHLIAYGHIEVEEIAEMLLEGPRPRPPGVEPQSQKPADPVAKAHEACAMADRLWQRLQDLVYGLPEHRLPESGSHQSKEE